MSTSLLKKIVAIATTVTCAVWMIGPGVAQGATVEDLLAQIALLEVQLKSLQNQLTTLEGGTPTPAISGCTITGFTRNLKIGMSGDDVKCLQIVLNSDSATQVAASGVGSSGSETTYFGSLTQAAVIKFQNKYADEVLASWGLTKGTGFVGSTTRTKLDSLLTATGGKEPPAPVGCECGNWIDVACGGGTCESAKMQQARTCAPGEGAAANVCEGTSVSRCAESGTCAALPTTGLKAEVLLADAPARAVAKGAYDKVFTKIKFTAGTDSDYTITSIAVHRNGLADDNDISEVKLYDESTKVGTTQALNTSTYKATFSSLNWTIAAGTSKTLTIKATLDATNATAGNSPNLGIALAADIVTSDGATVGGVFPIYGNYMTIAGTSVGQLDVDANDNSVSGNVVSGTTEQKVGSFKFTASAAEGFDVEQLVFTEIGTSVSSDIKNIKLKYLDELLGTAASLTDDQAVFTGSTLLSIAAGSSKNIDLYADISSEVISARTIRFELTETSDVTAIGKNTGGVVLVTYNSGTVFITQQSSEWTIQQGTLTVALDTATNPSATYYAIGTVQAPIVSFKFSAGSREGIKVTKLKLTEGGSISDNEYQNVRLYIGSSATPTGDVGSISSSVITFTNSDGLFTVPKSSNTIVTVKADITTAADDGDQIKMYIGAASSAETQITMKGAESGAKIYSDTTHITLSSVNTGNVNTMTVKERGSLTVTDSPDSPSGVNMTVGQTNVEIARFKLSAEWEDMLVSSVKVRLWNDSDVTDSNADTATASGDVSNARLYLDGPTGTLLGEVATPPAGYANFSTNFTVTKVAAKTLSLVIDIPTTSALSYLTGTLGQYTGYTAAGVASTSDELTTTGKMSSKSIYETGGAKGNLFTLQTPTLTVTAASTPPAQQIVTNSSNTWLGRLQLAGAYEDIKVTKVQIGFDDGTGINSDSSAEDVFTNIKIKVGSTQIGTTVAVLNDQGGTGSSDIAEFLGIENLTVGKDQTVSLDIYADVTATSTDTANLSWYVGHLAAADIVGAGIHSNTGVTSTGTSQVSKATTVRSSGTLTVSVDANTPIATNHAVGLSGKSGIEFSKLKFEALYEDMKVTTLRITLTDSGNVTDANATTTAGSQDFNVLYLYDGSTQLASAPMTDSNVVFTSDTGLFVVPNGSYKVITVKADVFGLSTGALSGDSPVLYLANVSETEQLRGLGSSSNSSTTATAGTGSYDPQTYSNFGAQWLYKTSITVNKNAASPSGSATAGANAEILRIDVSADSKADAVLNTIALSISGTADLSTAATGNAYLCLSTVSDCSTNYLAVEEATSAVTLEGGGAAVTTATTTQGSWDGIPTGATVHILDTDGSTWRTAKVSTISDESAAGVATLTFSAAVDANIGDKIYYKPLQPGSGKLFFGAMNYLNGGDATGYADTSITVDSTDGFASGDTVKIYGYPASSSTATTSAALTIATTTATVLYFDSAIEVAIDYNRNVDDAIGDSIADRAIVYTDSGDENIEEAISAGTTKTFIIKGDTTGAPSTKTIRADIAAVGDLKWDDKVQHMINARTKNLPIIGGTLTY